MAGPDRVACLREAAASSGGSGASAEEALARSGRFEESYEWRIGTMTDRGIERSAGGFRAWASTDGTWEAEVTNLADALLAMRTLSSLQQSLFYAISWPSSAAGTTREGGRSYYGGWSHAPRNLCERYLTGLWSAYEAIAADQAREAARIVAQGDPWETNGLRLQSTAPLTVDEDTGKPDGPDWYEVGVAAPGLRFLSASPTSRRALEVGFVYRQLAADLASVLGWDLVSG